VKRKIGMTPEQIKEADSEIQYAERNRALAEVYYQKLLEKYGGIIAKHPLLSKL
jgi:hypothetical protein